MWRNVETGEFILEKCRNRGVYHALGEGVKTSIAALQIARGLPLLMYPVAAVEAAVARAAADFPSDPPDSAEHFLALALYSLEREDAFSGDLIIVSI